MPIPNTFSGIELLRECCASRAPVTVVGDEETHWGSFLHFDVDLTLELLPGADSSFVLSSVYAVCFGKPPKSSVLLAKVKHYDGGSRHLLLTSLSPITRLERRSSHRLPVPVNSGLTVVIEGGGQKWVPKPMGMSMGGMSVKFPMDQATELEAGASVDIKLKLDHHTAELSAKVVRQDKGSVGLAFRQPVPQSLQRIYELLERGTPKT
jgi:hypothetical protein